MLIDIPDKLVNSAKSALVIKAMVGNVDMEKDPIDRLVTYIVGYSIKQKKENIKSDLKGLAEYLQG